MRHGVRFADVMKVGDNGPEIDFGEFQKLVPLRHTGKWTMCRLRCASKRRLRIPSLATKWNAATAEWIQAAGTQPRCSKQCLCVSH